MEERDELRRSTSSRGKDVLKKSRCFIQILIYQNRRQSELGGTDDTRYHYVTEMVSKLKSDESLSVRTDCRLRKTPCGLLVLADGNMK